MKLEEFYYTRHSDINQRLTRVDQERDTDYALITTA